MTMNKVGTVIGVFGIAVCVGSVIGRFIGEAAFLNFQAINMYNVGVGLIVLGCFAKLCGR